MTYKVVLDDFEDLVKVEVVCGLEAATGATPWQRLPVLAVGLELQERVVNAVEEHLVVDVLTLNVKVLRHLTLQLLHGDALLCCLLQPGLLNFILSSGLSLFFERQVELKGENLGELLIEMLTATDFRILQLVENDEGFSAEGLVEDAEETLGVLGNLLVDLINVALDRKEVGFYATALGTVLSSHFCTKNLNAKQPRS